AAEKFVCTQLLNVWTAEYSRPHKIPSLGASASTPATRLHEQVAIGELRLAGIAAIQKEKVRHTRHALLRAIVGENLLVVELRRHSAPKQGINSGLGPRSLHEQLCA